MARKPRTRSSLGVYTDAIYGVGEDGVVADPIDYAFLRFAHEVGKRFDRHVFIGRTRPQREIPDGVPLPDGTALVPLPDYGSLRNVGSVARASPRTLRAFTRAIDGIDVVWVFGPHPLALLLAGASRIRGRRVVLGVRQNSREYFRRRAAGPRDPRLLLARAVDCSFRALTHRMPVTAVGPVLAAEYGGGQVLSMTVALTRAEDVASSVPDRDWENVELIAVGRIEPEKNPQLLVDALAELERARPGRQRLVWLGHGTLETSVRDYARKCGVHELIDFRGYVPFDEVLSALRRANVFVLTSWTEGVPQALVEARACGTSIVATDVGGVRAALDDGRAGLLVAPGDSAAVADAVRQLTADSDLRRRLAERALELARAQTLEREAERTARFLGAM